MTDLRLISGVVKAYGFEPSKQEFKKLESGTTDLDAAMPGYRPKYLEESYFPYAITDASDACILYVTKSVGASSTLRPNPTITGLFRRGGWGEKFDIVASEEVPSKRLGEFVKEQGIELVDFLKLDTQGNEFDILKDRDTLSKVSVLKTEVEFLPLYMGQKLYCDIASLMRANGFTQFDLRFDSIHYRGMNPEALTGGILTWADAYFLNDRVSSPQALKAQVLVLLDLGNDDLALSVARRSGAISDDEFFALHAWFLRERKSRLTLAQSLKRKVEKFLGISISRTTR